MRESRSEFPYATAQMSRAEFTTDSLAPAQRYVLRPEFEKVRTLRWALLEHGYDILRLNDGQSGRPNPGEPVGFLKVTLETTRLFDYSTRELEQEICITPPIIERSMEADGSVHNIIMDGLHRCFLAHTCWMNVQGVLIREPSHPYYAYPLRGGWNDVQIIEELGPHFTKKFHRTEQNKALYRDLETVFPGVGGPRGHG
jgi:hypothetical protein